MYQVLYTVYQYPYDKFMQKMGKKIRAALSVALRVPSLFVVDAILNLRVDTGWFGTNHPVLCAFVLIIGLLVASIMFCLSTRTLLKIYIILLCTGTLVSTLWWNNLMLDKLDNSKNVSDWDVLIPSEQTDGDCNTPSITAIQIVCSFEFILYVVVQAFYSFTYVACMALIPEHFALNVWLSVGLYFISPMLLRLGTMFFGLEEPEYSTMIWVNSLSVVIPICELASVCVSNITWAVLQMPAWYRAYQFMLKNFGISSIVENAWLQLQVPNVLRTFWLLRFAAHTLQIGAAFVSGTELPGLMGTNESHVVRMNAEDGVHFAWTTFLELATHGCDSTLAVLGLTAIVSYLSYYLGKCADKFMGGDSDEVAHIGTVTAILFFILSLQTGLPGLEPMKRFIRLFRNFILLATALLHFIHSMLNHVMMALSTSHTLLLWKHFRALCMSTILLALPVFVINYLWRSMPVGTWLLAVTAFCLELVIKVIITLIIYALFLVDTYRDRYWEKLDDCVYYIKATGSTIEFVFGIFLFGNGIWILCFESGGVIRAIMIVIHAYFNIFQLGRNGWRKFQNRRMAVRKINNLPLATEEQLQRHGDVCAICYQELAAARVTPCEHLFHAMCLRKWLYIQDTCPMCHKEIMRKKATAEGAAEVVNEENEGVVDRQ